MTGLSWSVKCKNANSWHKTRRKYRGTFRSLPTQKSWALAFPLLCVTSPWLWMKWLSCVTLHFLTLVRQCCNSCLSVIKLDKAWVVITHDEKLGPNHIHVSSAKQDGYMRTFGLMSLHPLKAFWHHANFGNFFLVIICPQPLWIFDTFVCSVLIHTHWLNTSIRRVYFLFSFFLY